MLTFPLAKEPVPWRSIPGEVPWKVTVSTATCRLAADGREFGIHGSHISTVVNITKIRRSAAVTREASAKTHSLTSLGEEVMRDFPM
jgi:hypothetical protein